MKSRKYVYLLIGLIPPGIDFAPSDTIERISLEKIIISLKRVFLTERERVRKVPMQYECKDIFAFYINDGMKDDNLAQDFAHAVMFSLALACDVVVEDPLQQFVSLKML